MNQTPNRQTVLAALKALSELLQERGVVGEICLLGGTVMMLAFNAREATKDVDAIFQPATIMRELARIVQQRLDLPDDWLNDGAKGFVSARHEVTEHDLPQFEHLRVTAPTAQYMLAMKCIAARVADADGGMGDVGDIEFLVRQLGFSDPGQAVAVVSKFYPDARVPARTQFVIEDVFSRLKGGA